MTTKITIELEIESPNELTAEELSNVKEAVERTLYEYDNFTYEILDGEYGLSEVSVSCADEDEE